MEQKGAMGGKVSDYIDRQAAIDILEHEVELADDWKTAHEMLNVIKYLPSAVVRENVRGKWKRHYSRANVYADLFWHCSNCGYKNDNDYAHRHHKYCPNCGCQMKGEELD